MSPLTGGIRLFDTQVLDLPNRTKFGFRLLQNERTLTFRHNMVSVQVEQVSHDYRSSSGSRVPALESLDLSVGSGECLALIGPSGAGKSTLLRVMAGLERPVKGRVLLAGEEVLRVRPGKRGISLVVQDPPLYPSLSVWENLVMPLKRQGSGGGEARDRVEKESVRWRLADRLLALPRELSGGERQRVAVLRALLANPGLLLLDEPFANLDPPLRYEIKRLLSDWQQESGSTMVMVTHDPFDAAALGDRIGVMRQGRLIQIDSPDDIYHSPSNTFVAGFVGYPPINLIEGRLELEGDQCVFVGSDGGEGRVRIPLAAHQDRLSEGAVILGVRPSGLGIANQQGGGEGLFSGEFYRGECFGDRCFAEIRVGNLALVVEHDVKLTATPGGVCQLSVDSSKILLFDAGNGERLA